MPNVVRNLFNTFTHTENKSAYTKKKKRAPPRSVT